MGEAFGDFKQKSKAKQRKERRRRREEEIREDEPVINIPEDVARDLKDDL
jgi:hypothetical protein